MKMFLSSILKTTVASIFLLCCLVSSVNGQKKITIDECYVLARNNYPLSKQKELLEKSRDFSITNISKGYYPKVAFFGQATYQSDVTEIPISIPGIVVDHPSRDQYKIYGEINQNLYEGRSVKIQKEQAERSSRIEEQSLEVELYALRERVQQLYFGALLIDLQLDQNNLFISDLKRGLDQVLSRIKNGAALKSNGDMLKAELLKSQQREVELRSAKNSYLQLLSLFTNEAINDSSLVMPSGLILASEIKRPELFLFEKQSELFKVQEQLVTARNMPKASLFLQAGYGRPALNFLKNNFESYYIGGIRLNFPLAGFYTLRNDKAIIGIQNNKLQLQKETFLFNINFSITRQLEEIQKLQQLINTDEEIILLRSSIKSAASAQHESGVISSSDLLRELIAEDNARILKSVHMMQLLMAQYSYNTITGN
jgi:outer membrane protein TolC